MVRRGKGNLSERFRMFTANIEDSEGSDSERERSPTSSMEAVKYGGFHQSRANTQKEFGNPATTHLLMGSS